MTARTRDVVVVGASVAGLACGAALARAGADVVVLDQRDRIRSADPGLALVGTPESPSRLLGALGTSRTQALVAFSSAAVEGLPRQGAVVRAYLPRDARYHSEDGQALATLGLRSDPMATVEGLGQTGFTAATRVLADRVVDTCEVKLAYAREIEAAGAALRFGAGVERVDDGAPAQVHLGEERIEAELIVLACGIGASALEPWLHDKLWPVRAQWRRLSGDGPWPVLGVVAQQGHLWWRSDAQGFRHGGARWATPHLEVGETDLTPSSAVDARLADVLAQCLPAVAGSVVERRARIEAVSCDNLPLIGARPGGGRTLLLTGFGEHELSWAVAAGEVLATGILDGRADTPALLRPDRLVL